MIVAHTHPSVGPHHDVATSTAANQPHRSVSVRFPNRSGSEATADPSGQCPKSLLWGKLSL